MQQNCGIMSVATEDTVDLMLLLKYLCHVISNRRGQRRHLGWQLVNVRADRTLSGHLGSQFGNFLLLLLKHLHHLLQAPLHLMHARIANGISVILTQKFFTPLTSDIWLALAKIEGLLLVFKKKQFKDSLSVQNSKPFQGQPLIQGKFGTLPVANNNGIHKCRIWCMHLLASSTMANYSS